MIHQKISIFARIRWLNYFRAIGFFNEANTLESSSILTYSKLQTGLKHNGVASCRID